MRIIKIYTIKFKQTYKLIMKNKKQIEYIRFKTLYNEEKIRYIQFEFLKAISIYLSLQMLARCVIIKINVTGSLFISKVIKA